MSTTELRLVEEVGSALSRVIDVALRMQEHEEVDRWEFADDIAAAVAELGGEDETVSVLRAISTQVLELPLRRVLAE